MLRANRKILRTLVLFKTIFPVYANEITVSITLLNEVSFLFKSIHVQTLKKFLANATLNCRIEVGRIETFLVEEIGHQE